MTAIVAMNVALILHNRSAAHRWIARGGRTNRVLWLIVGTTVAAWAAVLAVPALRALFRIDAPTLAMAAWLLPCIAVAVAALRLAGRRPLGAAPAAPG
jgi:hypothetical protein